MNAASASLSRPCATNWTCQHPAGAAAAYTVWAPDTESVMDRDVTGFLWSAAFEVPRRVGIACIPKEEGFASCYEVGLSSLLELVGY